MKKRILSLLLTLLMLVGMIPATSLSAFAAAGGEVYVGGVKMSDGTYLAVGATATQTTKPSGGYAYYKDGKLTLNNYSYKGKGYLNISSSYYEVIYSKNDLTLELIGNNTLTHTYSDTDLIYVDGANLTVGGDGKLTGTADNYGLYADKDITINGGTIELSTFHAGIFSCDDVIINDGDITAESEIDDGIYASCDVTINGGHVTAIGNAQAIRYDSSYSFTVAKGMEIQASTTVDGTLGEYVAAYHSTYKKIEVRPAHAIYVGDVCMDDGDYLAVGATATQTTKPSGGYAYYKDGKLTLNNYSYEGTGYQYISIGYCAIVYAKHDLTLELVGTNSLVQERENSDVICIQSEDDGGCLTIDGTGSLSATTTVGYAGIEVDGTLTVNGGTIDCAAKGSAMISRDQDIIINGGNVTASGRIGLNAPDGNVKINGGNVLATGTTSTWGAISATNFTVAEGMKIQASTTADGALGEYVASKHSNYKKIVIESPAINTVNVSATWSGTPKDATTSTTGAAVTATKWYRKSGSNWVQLGSFDTIYSEYTYRCEVTVGATSGYTLADGYTVKINGIAATKKSGNTWYVDKTITGIVDYVDIVDIDLPEAGARPDMEYEILSGNLDAKKTKIEWFECNKNGSYVSTTPLAATDLYKEDTYYRVNVTVYPREGYVFDGRNLSAYINDPAANYYYNNDDSVTMFAYYSVHEVDTKNTIDVFLTSKNAVTLKDGEYLAQNSDTPTTAAQSDNYMYYKDGVLYLNNYKRSVHLRYSEKHLEVDFSGDNAICGFESNYNDYDYTAIAFYGGADDYLDLDGMGRSSCTITAYAAFFNGGNYVLDDGTYVAFWWTDYIEVNGGADIKLHLSQYGPFSEADVTLCVNEGAVEFEDQGTWQSDWLLADLTIANGTAYVKNSYKDEYALWDQVSDFNDYDFLLVQNKKIVTYKVVFIDDNDTVLDMVRVNEGETVAKPADPVKDGYTFLGWYTDGGTKFDFTTPITGDITLTAKFEDATSNVKLGDVNGDDTIDYADIQCIYQHMSTDSKLTGDALIAADVNKDGAVDYGDIQRLYQHLSTDNKLS